MTMKKILKNIFIWIWFSQFFFFFFFFFWRLISLLVSLFQDSLYDWFICGGGLVTLVSCGYFSICCILTPVCRSFLPGIPTRRGGTYWAKMGLGSLLNQSSLLTVLMVVGLATLMQAALCTFSFSWIIQVLPLMKSW